jgi:polyisoprenoid-binding protein YceI
VAVSFATVSASLLVCALAAATSLAAHATEIDTEYTRIGFTLKTRWGQVLQGRFPRYSGRIDTLDDGRYRVRLRMSAKDVEIVDHPNYTGMTRGRGFFEADRFSEVEFVSEPYAPALVADGGKLAGQLTIRDVTRRETFTIDPSTCARPAVDCDVVANGSVRRTDYGVDRWVFAVSDSVRFTLRLRVRGAGE